MAFYFSTNNTPVNHTHCMYLLKQLFSTASGWAVTGSGDGISNVSLTSDILTGYGNNANELGNDRAWFRVKGPSLDGYQREFTFQRIGNSSTHHMWRVKYIQFGNTSGGNAITTPYSSDEAVVVGTGSDASPTGSSVFGSTANGLTRYHACVADAASGGGFWTSSPFINNSSTNIKHGFLFERMKANSFHPLDQDPYVFYRSVNDWQVNVPNYPMFSKENLSYCYAYIRKNMTGQVLALTSALSYMDLTRGSADQCVHGIFGTNPHDNKDDALPIIFATRTAIQPVGYKGISSTIHIVGTNRTTGDTFTLNTTRDRIVINYISLPWDGSIPVI